jgi:hypothetical protein
MNERVNCFLLGFQCGMVLVWLLWMIMLPSERK